jgi:hypothetical protein
MPPSRCVEADIQFFISGFGVKAVAFGKAQLGLQIAESVEKVGAVRLFATIVPLSGACGNIDSTLSQSRSRQPDICVQQFGLFWTTLPEWPEVLL